MIHAPDIHGNIDLSHLPKGTEVQIWTPHPGPQTDFFSCPADIILYGGAKGGGKTAALLVFCALGVQYSGYKSIFFRRSYKELELEVIPKSHEMFGKVGRYDGTNHRWIFRTPDGGQAYIYFSYLQHESDVFNYQGAQFPRIAFDESTFYSEQSIRYMIGCLRSSVPNIRRQMALGANPIGPGFGWHKELFIKDKKPYVVYFPKEMENDPSVTIKGERGKNFDFKDIHWPSDGKLLTLSTCFIPAKFHDNPTLMESDPDYEDKMRAQYGVIADALMHGSWDQTIDIALPQFDDDESTANAADYPLPYWAPRIISIDYGKTHAAAATWICFTHNRVLAYRDFAIKGMDLKPFCHEVVRRSIEVNEHGQETPEPITCVVLSHELFADQGMGTARADQASEIFDKQGWIVCPSGRDPEGRLELLREYMRRVPLKGNSASKNAVDYDYWMEQVRKRGIQATEEFIRLTRDSDHELLPKLLIFRPTPDGKLGCPDLIKRLPTLVTELGSPFVIADGQEDDSFDALTTGLKYNIAPTRKPIQEIFRERMAALGMPDSPIAAELMRKEIAKEVGEEDDGWKPRVWKKETFRS